MVLTGLPADGKASFWIAPHCGFRYRKRRFYRILMLLARYDGHMNDSNTPYSKNRENQSKSLLFMNGGRAKTTTNRTRRRKLSIYSIGTASKYCATPVAFAEPADSPDCIAPSKISAAAANSTVSSIKSPLFGANPPFDKP